jgi:pantoate--beta-alanine ligase
LIKIETVAGLREALSPFRKVDKRIGFVPTMGALHTGHLSLVELSKRASDVTVVSIFVNPTQFGPNEDFTKYPRTLEADATLLEIAGVDVLFLPSVVEMYPDGATTSINVGELATVFEGAIRPGHFDGVATVVAKLFNQVEPDLAFFGQKDAQQVAVLKKMVRDLCCNVEIVIGETARETDGLALSSRNRYLSATERKESSGICVTLVKVLGDVTAGKTLRLAVEDATRYFQTICPNATLDYLDIVVIETFRKMDSFNGVDKLLIVIAARFGSTRLIDNLVIDRPTIL